ncbi:conserved hypothetical protein [Hahella chejuensis KCTC 2396]|uniref:Uncharacterized protein n=1 Tax=Hahella chejuensis (strain KCTC 2396) TaxID=349521 RepID=Q2SMF1_HAHCH|nr:hypothetical protein [Hahella chejuensis]ABC28173.1 conserved hypothetical protein [Hahella chejuensis KCTC 2396]
MDLLRVLLSLTVFVGAVIGVVSQFTYGFNGWILAASIAGFILAHYLWPSKKHRRGDSGWLDALDWLEFIIDIGFELVMLPFRLIRALFRDGDVGVDL